MWEAHVAPYKSGEARSGRTDATALSIEMARTGRQKVINLLTDRIQDGDKGE